MLVLDTFTNQINRVLIFSAKAVRVRFKCSIKDTERRDFEKSGCDRAKLEMIKTEDFGVNKD